MKISSKTSVTFINSFRGSGIGDFGWKLFAELKKSNDIVYHESTPSWKGLLRIWKTVMSYKGVVIFNLGFTSFGKSAIRNLLNFMMIKIWSNSHPNTIVILHDSVDTSNLSHSGYSHLNIISLGGNIATKMLKDCKIFVFARHFLDILKSKYGFKNVYYFPFPCEEKEITKCYNNSGSPMLINLGYIAPYKGIEILPEVKIRLKSVDISVVGNFHKTLLTTQKGITFKNNIEKLMRNAGIDLLGYLTDDQVKDLVSRYKTIAVMPYHSGYNASSSALYFVSLGIPVVASKIDVFTESKLNGAGIILVDRDADSFVTAILGLINNNDVVERLIADDISYCEKYSMETFSNFLHGFL